MASLDNVSVFLSQNNNKLFLHALEALYEQAFLQI